MLRGKKPGRTTLSIWDQKRVLRHEIELVVTTRDAERIEADLAALLAPYPDVKVSKLGGGLLLTGTVRTSAGLAAVNTRARGARVQSAVTVHAATASGGSTGAVVGSGGVVAGVEGAAPAVVEYELELFEASTQFKTGDYGRGVEPSGRSLYKGTVRAAVGEAGEIFIGGTAVDPEAAKNAKGKPQPEAEGAETGIRLTLRPQPGRSGIVTAVEVETN